jgi:hypothetical protein
MLPQETLAFDAEGLPEQPANVLSNHQPRILELSCTL